MKQTQTLTSKKESILLRRNCQFCNHNISPLVLFLPNFVSEIPHLRHLAVHFRPMKEEFRTSEISHLERKAGADKVLASIRQTLQQASKLEQLSIHNVPISARFAWTPGRPYKRTQDFSWQWSGLESLKIGYVDVDIGTRPNQNKRLEASEQKILFEKLTPPIPTHAFSFYLRHLSISCWGFYGRRSLMDFPHFRSLKSLELRGVAFTSGFDLDWIERHSSNLRSLVLIDCAIVYRLDLKRKSIDVFHPKVHIVPNGRKGVQYYKARWHDWFKVLRTNLALENFQIGSNRVRASGEMGPVFESETRKGPGFQETPQFLFGLFPDRYLMMNEGNSRTPWKLECPNAPQKPPPKCDLKDLSALSQLMDKIGQLVEGDTTSRHAGYVRKWMGHVRPKELLEDGRCLK